MRVALLDTAVRHSASDAQQARDAAVASPRSVMGGNHAHLRNIEEHVDKGTSSVSRLGRAAIDAAVGSPPVSYTHLTLPTICSV